VTNPGNSAPNPLASLILGQNSKVVAQINDATTSLNGAQSVRGLLSYSDTDNSYIKDLENWSGKSHQYIYTHAQELMPGLMQAHIKQWSEILTELSGGLFGANLSIQNTLAESLKGQIGTAAADAATKFFKQVNDIGEVITSVTGRLQSVADASVAVKMSVPPPADSSAVPGGAPIPSFYQSLGVSSAAASMAAGRSEEEQYRVAIAAMQANYDPTYKPAGDGVPTFVHVDSPNGVGPTTTNNPGNGTLPTVNGPEPRNTNPTSQQPDNSKQTSPSNVDSSSQSPNADNQGMSPQSTIPSSVSPTSTNAAGYNGGGLGSGGGMGGGGGGFGGFGGGGGGNAGTNSGPGRSIPGAGFASSERAAAAAAANAGRAGTAGMNGMPGMGGAGARKSESTDSEHTTPDYLVMDREEELIGHLDPMAPGAIGANFPAAQTRRVEGEDNGR